MRTSHWPRVSAFLPCGPSGHPWDPSRISYKHFLGPWWNWLSWLFYIRLGLGSSSLVLRFLLSPLALPDDKNPAPPPPPPPPPSSPPHARIEALRFKDVSQQGYRDTWDSTLTRGTRCKKRFYTCPLPPSWWLMDACHFWPWWLTVLPPFFKFLSKLFSLKHEIYE